MLTTIDAVLADGGELSDLTPTALELLGIEQPAAMTGKSLLIEQPVYRSK